MLVLELRQKGETNSRFPVFLIKSSYVVPGEILSIALHCIYQQKAHGEFFRPHLARMLNSTIYLVHTQSDLLLEAKQFLEVLGGSWKKNSISSLKRNDL